MPVSADRRRALLVFAAVFFVYAASAVAVLCHLDDLSMVEQAQSIVERGSAQIARGPGAVVLPDGRVYCIFAVGQSLLEIPLYLVGGAVQRAFPHPAITNADHFVVADARIYVLSLLGPLLIAWSAALLYLVCRRLGYRARASIATALLFAFATFVWHSGRTLMSEPACVLTLMLAFYGLLQFAALDSNRWLLISGIAAGFSIAVRWPNAIALAPMGLWLLWRQRRERPIASALVWGTPIAVAIVSLAVFNRVRYGSIWETGYTSSLSLMTVPFYVGIAGFLVSPGRSLFVFAPITILAVAGYPRLWREHRAVALISISAVLGFILFYCRFYLWFSGAWGPRYLIPVLPFVCLGLAPLLDRPHHRLTKIAVAAVAAASVAVQLLGVLIPYALYMAIAAPRPDHYSPILWEPLATQIAAHVRYLISGQFFFDLAPVLYHWNALWWIQGTAFVLGLACLLKLARARE